MRLALIIALAVLLLPRDTLERMTHAARTHGYDLVTICERHPEDCSAVAERIKSGGVAVADFSARAASQLRGALEDGLQELREFKSFGPPDRGTLREDDLAPAWRGHED